MQEFKSPYPSDPNLETQVLRNTSNLRNAFMNILFLHSKGRAQEVALIYKKLFLKTPKDTLLKAQYVFSHFVGTASFMESLATKQQKVVYYLLSDPVRIECNALREEVLKDLPKSPEVKIMTAMFFKYNAKWSKSLELASQALFLDSNWGYSYYLRGQSLTGSNIDIKDKNTRLKNAKSAISDFKMAEKLNPELKFQNLYYEYVHTYSELADYKTALTYMDKIIAVVKEKNSPPEKMQMLTTWRKSIASKIKS
jgi:tetratricopeptide (TPR) repeat protein